MIPETLAPGTIWLHPPDSASPGEAARAVLRGWRRPRLVSAADGGISTALSDAVRAGYASVRAAGERDEPAAAEWRVAIDPVCLQAGMRDMQISHATPPELKAADAQALADALVALVADDADARLRELRLDVAAPARWYLSGRNADQLRIDAPSPHEAARESLRDALPSGPDAALAIRLLTEAQMVLHGHAVNANRVAAGLPAVNSVWLHGAGPRPRVARRSLPALVSDDAVLRGLWRLAGAAGASAEWTPEAVAAALDGPGRSGVILAPCAMHDVRELSAALQLAVGEGRVRRLMVPVGERIAIAAPRDRWCLWRQPRPAALATGGPDAPNR